MFVLQLLIFGSFLCLVAFYAKFLRNRRRLYKLAAKIPGPQGLPLIGSAHRFMNKDFKQIFEVLVTITKGFGDVAKLWLGPELLIFVESPESLQIVLNSQKCMDKSPLYDILLLCKGLVVGNGQLWKHHRKILNPAFRINVLKQLIPTFDEKSKSFAKNLEAKVGKPEFDIFRYMSACSLETLLKGTMDIDRDIQSDPLGNNYLHHAEM